MKPMLDKDFDQIFKSSFEDFEVQPAANSWDKITDKLDKKPKKNSFGIFWMAAASVVVVLGIGIGLFSKSTEVIKIKGNSNEILSQTSKEKNNYTEVIKDVENRKSKPVVYAKNKNVLANNQATISTNKNNFEPDATISNTNNVSIIKDTENEPSQIVATKPIRTKTVTERILEDEASKNIEASKVKTQTLLAQNAIDKNLIENSNQTNRKLKIRSIGDLVNFVVAKVDKREEKIIKVSKTDESDNEITGINLGLIRFRKLD
jgi:hypothetical protein